MIHTIDRASSPQGARLSAMFEARKRVFVDLLKWDVPVLGGTWELDDFDDDEATYLIVSDASDSHLASARLLKTTRPHLLDSLFATLVDGEVPTGDRTFEITRFCLDRSLRACERRPARDRLVTALVRHALDAGIDRYTGVAEPRWFEQVSEFGWQCRPLGRPRRIGNRDLVAMSIAIGPDTPELLARKGIWSHAESRSKPSSRQPAAAGQWS